MQYPYPAWYVTIYSRVRLCVEAGRSMTVGHEATEKATNATQTSYNQ